MKTQTAHYTLILFIAACMAFLSTETHAQETWTSGMLGKRTVINSLVGPYQSSACPEGKYVIGLEVRSGWWIDGMRVQCATLGPNGEHQAHSQSIGLNAIGSYDGGQMQVLRCPSGQVLTAFKGRAGEFIDRLQFACRGWNAQQGSHGATTWMAAQGGTGGEPYGPAACPDGMAVTQLNGKRAGSYVGFFYFHCQGPPTPPATAGAPIKTAQSTLQPQGRPAPHPQPATRAGQTQVTKSGVRVTRRATETARITGLSRAKSVRGGAELQIDGTNFIIFVNGRKTPNVTSVEIAGTVVKFAIVSPTQMTATVPRSLTTTKRTQSVPVTIVSDGKRISGRFPLR